MLFLNLSSSYVGHQDDDDEDREYEHLVATLFMFSVCHVIVFLHEGVRFDTQILKKLRVLQAAKHALAPFVRSQVILTPEASSVSPQRRRNGVSNRHSSSSISLMSGSGSHPSVLPGHCVPVILFVFCDHLSEGLNPGPSGEDLTDALTQNQSSNGVKGSGSVVMLARPPTRSEGNVKKKLHSFLDSQIRFLIKKCRILAGAEPNSRGVGNVNSLPLLSLDASRVVALIDKRMNQGGEALDFVAALIEEAFDSKAMTDISMFESQCQALNDEEIQVVKDFIYRQSDALRGRGALPSNANSGSVAGVGMVAVAAAAAAASVAAGKHVSAPELPCLEKWLTSSNVILSALFSVEHGVIDKNGNIRTQSLERSATKTQDGRSAAEAAVTCLESSMTINMKFSLAWCQKALPVAKEVYLKDLPSCYPTALHKEQLGRALHAFKSMVKGPAVQMFAKRLEDECTSIWESGRQLCDAVSLTGKPCMHKRHNTTTCDSVSGNVLDQHSSGYLFLHACPCGRSRHLQDDPFDFDSANGMFSCSACCKDVLPSLILPKGSSTERLPLSSWALLRLGGARYYEAEKGLLQIGFVSREKFLLKWIISHNKQKSTSFLPTLTGNCSLISSRPDVNASPIVKEEAKKPETAGLREVHSECLEDRKQSAMVVSSADTSISFGKGLPSFTMKKPFSEVVAGTAVEESSFPLLQQSKQPKASPAKGAARMLNSDQHNDRVHVANGHPKSQRTEPVNVQESLKRPETNRQTEGDPFLQIGNNVVPVNMLDDGNRNPNCSSNQVVVYVGFEHECPYGHRFLLSPEHLMELHSSYSEDSQRKHDETSNILHGQVLPDSSKSASTAVTKRNNKLTKVEANSSRERDRFTVFPRSGLKKFGLNVPSSVDELEVNQSRVILDDASSAFSLLNRNLPLYMNCPHCKNSKQQEHQNIKFASTISQLHRIFLVTPPFPTVLATCPVIQFEDKCLPPSTSAREQQSRYTLACQVILPPESFLTIRLPFVYGVQKEDGSLQPLNQIEHQPELTAWLVKGTTLQVVSMGHVIDEEYDMQ